MSFHLAASLARDHATQARREADEVPVSIARVEAFDRDDRRALVSWLKRRIAQEFDRFANVLEQCAREDVTVLDRRKPG
jgi:2'-5' RNA ligase